MLIYAFQEEPQTLKQALKTADCEKWLAASKEEYDNLIEMGTWKLVSLPHDKRPIKCRWRYVIKADGRFCQNLSLVSLVVGRHLGCPRCTVIGTQCVKTDT